MKANELRIGNLVLADLGHVCLDEGVVFNILQSYVRISLDTDLEDSIVYYENLHGIPLTEEWLLRLGLSARDLLLLREVIANYKNISEDDVILDYVHQLQNLYFALTGEELTLTNLQIDHKK